MGLLSHKQEFPLYALVSERPKGQSALGQIPITISPHCNIGINCWFISFLLG